MRSEPVRGINVTAYKWQSRVRAHPDVEGAVEAIPELATALVLVTREELAGRELDTCVCGFGSVEGSEDKLQYV